MKDHQKSSKHRVKKINKSYHLTNRLLNSYTNRGMQVYGFSQFQNKCYPTLSSLLLRTKFQEVFSPKGQYFPKINKRVQFQKKRTKKQKILLRIKSSKLMRKLNAHFSTIPLKKKIQTKWKTLGSAWLILLPDRSVGPHLFPKWVKTKQNKDRYWKI
jgi:hypothetical protein